MLQVITALLTIPLIFFSVYAEASSTEIFHGRAQNDAGELVYLERHQIHLNEKGLVTHIQTTYTSPDQKEPFAQLDSWFDENLTVPRSKFVDQRTQLKEEVSFENNGQTLVIARTEGANGRTRTQRLRVTDAMVHGQGYHNLIVRDFEQFTSNPKRMLDFVVPSRQTSYRFDLSFLGLDESQAPWVAFRLDISNWFLRMFADKIVVHYDPQTRRLMRYEGLTNIQSDRGENQSLTIQMIYSEDS
jgi:hypothetical protein